MHSKTCSSFPCIRLPLPKKREKWEPQRLTDFLLDSLQESVFLLDSDKSLHPLNHSAFVLSQDLLSLHSEDRFLCILGIRACPSQDDCLFHRVLTSNQPLEYLCSLHQKQSFRVRLVPTPLSQIILFLSPLSPETSLSDSFSKKPLPSSSSPSPIFDQINGGIVLLDSRHCILYANSMITRFLPSGSFLGSPIHEVLPALELEPFGEQRLLSFGGPSSSSFVLGYRCSEIDPSSQNEILIHFSDLTQVEHLRLEIQKLENLAEIGRLSSTMAHEIRNPLAGIQAMIQSLRPEIASLGLDYAVDMISDEIKRLSQLLSEYSLLRGAHEPRRQQADLKKILHLVLLSCSHRLQGIQTSFEIHKVPPLFVDTEQMRQLFLNLLLNALDALDAISDPSHPKSLRFLAHVVDSSLLIEIQDSGCGIPPHDLARIFDPFFTTKAHGTGLGLSVCRKIILSHKGRLDVESSPGQGTLFRILLPLLEPS